MRAKDIRATRLATGESLEVRLVWLLKQAPPKVAEDLETVAAMLGIQYSVEFLHHCYHAVEWHKFRSETLPDRYLSGLQLKRDGADAFRRAVGPRGRKDLGPHGSYPTLQG